MNIKQVGTPFVVLDQVDSTNNFAMKQIAKGKGKEGMAWLAKFQTEGKGQRGKNWFAKPGDNINLTLLLQPHFLQPTETFLLNMIISLSVYDFWEEFAGAGSSIKWSNDIFWHNKKAAGILIENQIRGSRWGYAVVGIGINLNQQHFPGNLPHAISLRQISGRTWDAENMARRLCKYIEQRYNSLEGADTDKLLQEYESHLFRLRKPALYRMGNEVFEGLILGVEKNGQLILQKQGKSFSVGFGEIRFVL